MESIDCKNTKIIMVHIILRDGAYHMIMIPFTNRNLNSDLVICFEELQILIAMKSSIEYQIVT
jgi:hypothetical protein